MTGFVCPKCGQPPDYAGHTKECMLKLISSYQCYESNNKRMSHWIDQVTRANDRAAALKHENNVLRKKVRKQ